MKNIFIYALMAAQALAFTACGGDDDNNGGGGGGEPGDEQPDTRLPLWYVDISKKTYYDMSGNFYEDGDTNIHLTYDGERPREMVQIWRDYLDTNDENPGDNYCENREVTTFEFTGNTVRAYITNTMTYYPSKRTEEESSVHEATLEDGRVTSGRYKFSDDNVWSDYEITYDSAGRLLSSRNNDSEPEWYNYAFSWDNGNMTTVLRTDNSNEILDISYSPTLTNPYRPFDLNWALPSDSELYDFAAGDITRIWGVVGLLGEPSKNLITNMNEKGYFDDLNITMTYQENNRERTVVRVDQMANGYQRYYSDWEITYSGETESIP